MVNRPISREAPIEVLEVDIPVQELRWSTVSLKEVLSKGGRLEASFFDVQGKHAREILEKNKWGLKPLTGDEGLADAYHRPRFKRIWVERSDYPIYQPSQITEVNPRPSGYLSELTHVDIDALRVVNGQVLLTCSGTIGHTTYVSNTLDGRIFSHDLIRINAHNEVDRGYIYAFLRTEVGNILVNTNNYGAVISHIEPEHLDAVLIPDAPTLLKAQIHDLVMQSFVLRDESNVLIREATRLLVEELKLPPVDQIKPKYFDSSVALRNYSVKLSDLDTRMDGSFHVPIKDAIVGILRENAESVMTIGDPRISERVILPGRFKRVYVEEGQGTVFFGGKQLYELDPTNKKYLSLTHHSKRIKEELTLKENMILVTCSGSIGKTVLVPHHWEQWTANQHVMRIIPSSAEIAGFLYIFLSSDYGFELIRRFTYGAVVDEIDDDHMSHVEVPLLKNKAIQRQINDLALEANRNRAEAYRLEQLAIKKVNEIIHTQG